MISANARCSFASQNFTNHVTFRCPLMPARRLTPTLLQERSIDCQCCRIHLSYGAAMPQREASRLILCGTICASCVARLIYASLTADFLVSTIIVIRLRSRRYCAGTVPVSTSQTNDDNRGHEEIGRQTCVY